MPRRRVPGGGCRPAADGRGKQRPYEREGRGGPTNGRGMVAFHAVMSTRLVAERNVPLLSEGS